MSEIHLTNGSTIHLTATGYMNPDIRPKQPARLTTRGCSFEGSSTHMIWIDGPPLDKRKRANRRLTPRRLARLEAGRAL